MVNQQLVDYVKQQLQGGIQKDAVKKALLDAGWPDADVNDSLSAASSGPAPSAPAVAVQPAIQSPAQPKPQTINPMAAMAGSSAAAPASLPSKPREKFFDDAGAAGTEHKGHGAGIAMTVMGAMIVALLVALGYIYFSLNGKITSMPGTGGASEAALNDLRGQVQTLTAGNAALSSQVTGLAADNQELKSEIGFLAVTSTSTAEIAAEAKGVLGGATGAYTLTTKNNLKISVKNSKDSKVDPVLKAYLGQSVTLNGTHKQGEAAITVTGINGGPLVVPTPPAATSTPASNPGATSTASTTPAQ